METLYSFSPRFLPVSITLTQDQLVYQSGVSYMKKRETIPVKNISTVEASAIAPTVTVKTNDGKEHKISVMKGSERDALYAALQKAVAAR